ncbi:Imm49 family immunity protein [Myxococcus qinghaiensis]|uniref:Imm49 family immunity protein n=1 Tax=Myxococcus qinghaiensis TaxID=2906758 RepID=UPI0020A816C5|nr:Imm49 family immunity protein [Myxococcus qinghaiensis]MCP3166660.1 immunity 49 family protein [Myxococcus qinghaiensis]
MRTVILNLSLELEPLREALGKPAASPAQHARRLHEVSRHERMLGIALLLAEADTDGFFSHLTLSAEAHARLLREARDSGQATRFAGTGNFHPFCDALVAGQVPLAREMARLAPEQWIPGEEYEEDFVYGRFLHALLLDGDQGLEQQEALLDRMARLDPEWEPRQRLCRALFERDAHAFEVALVEAASEHQRRCDELAATRFSPTLENHTERYVFIEGLALLRLAKAAGLQTEPEHKLMPSLARWRD